VIHAQGLRKSFGGVTALDGLDLDVAPGEVHGFLGPNGAGKSTTIRVVLGLVRPTGGEVTLFGSDPWTEAPHLHDRLAYVPGDVQLWPNLTGGQNLDILGATHGRLDPRRRDELVERFDLDLSRRASDYSKGNRQKVALVAALAADVELLVLDEPTSGLDPLMEAVFQECVRERRQEGVTVLLSSHILSEVEALADRVTIIRKGRRVTTGTLADLRRHTRTTVQAVTARAPDLGALEGVHGLTVESADGATHVRFAVDADALGAAVGQLHSAGLTTMTAEPPSLDELFLSRYSDEEVPVS
jgi:ABC-2 type transport system ATP-binding protein